MPLPPGDPPAGGDLALEAWAMLGGLDWQGLPTVMDILGIDDIEMLVAQLGAIRDWSRQKHGQ